MGFYAPAQLVRDARQHGIEILPIDVNHSRWDCTLEGPAIRLGLRMIVGLAQRYAARIEVASRPFHSVADFAQRTALPPAVITRLAKADAFCSLEISRALAQEKTSRPLWDQFAEDEPAVALPELSPHEEVLADYQTAGLSLKAHPLTFYREELHRLNIVPAGQLAQLADGIPIRVAGLVLVRQRPGTAKGITFVTLEDETGVANLIIRPEIWNRYHQAARIAPALIAHGRLQSQQGVIHVLVQKLDALSERLQHLRSQSRDFQ
jgi:error-prone DNA polymerase